MRHPTDATQAMPARIARLPRDPRGYPIPWNVLRANGAAFFTVNDDRRHWIAIRRGLCPICGEALGRWKWFVGGPRSAFDPNGWYSDLPGHRECIEFSLQTCPYLAAPKYLGRIDIADWSKLPPEARILVDETQIPEQQEVFVAVACHISRSSPTAWGYPTCARSGHSYSGNTGGPESAWTTWKASASCGRCWARTGRRPARRARENRGVRGIAIGRPASARKSCSSPRARAYAIAKARSTDVWHIKPIGAGSW